jgi:PAS domain S-box-containing protein
MIMLKTLRAKLQFISLVPLAAFLLAIILLLLSMDILSSARAYVGGESLWAKSQKEATFRLVRYATTRDPADYTAAQEALLIPLGDKSARQEMDKPRPDLDVIYQGFSQGGIHPDDIGGMVRLYRNFRWVSHLEAAIATWTEGDQLIEELISESDALYISVQENEPLSVIHGHTTRIEEIDRRLTSAENRFSLIMGQASRWIRLTLTAVIIMAISLITLATFWFIRRFSKDFIRDVSKIRRAAEDAAEGNYKRRIRLESTNELTSLANSLNILIRAVRSSTEKMEASLRESEQDKRQLEETKKAILNVLEDLNDEKTASDTARAKFEAILKSIGEGVLAVDTEGNVIIMNSVAERISGRASSKVIGQPYRRFLNFEPESDNDDSAGFIEKALAGHTVTRTGGSRLVSSKGQHLAVSVSAAPIRDPEGVILGAIVVFSDISKERALERSKDEFVSLASHQLRTPATAVKNFIGLLKEGYVGKLNNEQLQYLNLAYESNESQLEIVNNLLYVARTDADEVKLNFMQTDLVDVVRTNLQEHMSVLEARRQIITLDIPSRPVRVRADRQYMLMAVDNLISNASKYTPDKGEVHISVTSTREHCTISVQDTGVGIAEDDFDKLFRKFVRVPNSLSTVRGGSGIGLYLIKRIVDLHNGTIDVQSEPNKGTTFTITLPRE